MPKTFVKLCIFFAVIGGVVSIYCAATTAPIEWYYLRQSITSILP